MQSRRPIALALAAALVIFVILPSLAAAAVGVSADQLTTADVAVDAGATLDEAGRARLQDAADRLAERGFPTKFVVVAAQPASVDLDREAARLRDELAGKLGHIDRIDGVVLLAPRAVGVSADAFPKEIRESVAAELETFRTDPVQGAIAVMDRLQAFDEAAALPGDPESEKKDIATWVWIVGGAVLVVGIVAFVLARRAAKRGEAVRAVAGQSPPDDAP